MSELVTARLADSTRPAEIPDLFRLRPNGVAVYVDGSYRWHEITVAGFPRVWRICVTGNTELAPHARVLDVERFDATPDHVEAYRRARAELGERTIVYCSRDTVAAVVDACPNWHELEWWLATLDGQAWTPASITGWIRQNLGAVLEPDTIRAIQTTPMGHYDLSPCFGNPRFATTTNDRGAHLAGLAG